jgi:hypothetical protein
MSRVRYIRNKERLCMMPMVVQEKETFLDVVVANGGSSASFRRRSYQKTSNVHRQMVRSQNLLICRCTVDLNFKAGHEGTGKHAFNKIKL